MDTVLKKLGRFGVVPVVVLNDAMAAKPLAEALCRGGLACAEITFRTADAEKGIRIMCRNFPEMMVGAGTVLTIDQAKRAVSAGARFLVSPGLDPEIVDYCLSENITIIPGCMTPSEAAQGVKRGLSVLKFFPAKQAGGAAMIKALAAPYADIKFMPTGGINASNLEQYLSLPEVFACGGSWMVKSGLIASGKFEEIEKLTKEAASIVKRLRV